MYYLYPSLPCLSEKTYVVLCFSLKMGRSVMACFHLLQCGSDDTFTVWLRCSYIRYQYAFSCLMLYIMVCDLYFDSHILLYLIITLILIIHINCINCISVGEYHGYSLTVCKSLL